MDALSGGTRVNGEIARREELWLSISRDAEATGPPNRVNPTEQKIGKNRVTCSSRVQSTGLRIVVE